MHLILFYACKVHGNSHKSLLRKLQNFSIHSLHQVAVCKELHSLIIEKEVSVRIYVVSQFFPLCFTILSNKILSIYPSLNKHFYKLVKVAIAKGLVVTANLSFFVKVKQKQPGCHILPLAVHPV